MRVLGGVLLLVLAASSAYANECNILFNCHRGEATIDGASFPIICGEQTGREITNGGTIGTLIHASGPARRGLVAPGTPMITTTPSLCYDCFIHTGYGSRSLGCIGITSSGFAAMKNCYGSGFAVIAK
jgi:hypothetical protein